MQINNIITECYDGVVNTRGLWDVRCLAIHRILFEDTMDPVAIARKFVDDPEVSKYTGGETPYTFLVISNTVYQCLPLSDVGKHAKRWNFPAIGVGVVGDFRLCAPPSRQYNTLVDLCALLLPSFGLEPFEYVDHNGVSAPSLAGHSELIGGSQDPAKKCPGDKLSMEKLRKDVSDIMITRARQDMLAAGVVG